VYLTHKYNMIWQQFKNIIHRRLKTKDLKARLISEGRKLMPVHLSLSLFFFFFFSFCFSVCQ